MRKLDRSRARSLIIGSSWGPLALWLLAGYVTRDYDGWGAWAAAPMFLPAVLLSIGLGCAGVVVVLSDAYARRRPDWALIAATLLAGSVILYLVGANLAR